MTSTLAAIKRQLTQAPPHAIVADIDVYTDPDLPVGSAGAVITMDTGHMLHAVVPLDGAAFTNSKRHAIEAEIHSCVALARAFRPTA